MSITDIRRNNFDDAKVYLTPNDLSMMEVSYFHRRFHRAGPEYIGEFINSPEYKGLRKLYFHVTLCELEFDVFILVQPFHCSKEANLGTANPLNLCHLPQSELGNCYGMQEVGSSRFFTVIGICDHSKSET